MNGLLIGDGADITSVINVTDTYGYCPLHYLMHPYTTSKAKGQFSDPLNMHFIGLFLNHPRLEEVVSGAHDTYYTCLLQSHNSP